MCAVLGGDADGLGGDSLGLRPGRECLEVGAAKVAQQGLANLTSGGVAGADEQDSNWCAHCVLRVVPCSANFDARDPPCGCQGDVDLGDGARWPVPYGLLKWSPAVEKKVVALVKVAVSGLNRPGADGGSGYGISTRCWSVPWLA